MSITALTPALRAEYARLFQACTIRPERVGAVDRQARRIITCADRYDQVAQATGVPWWLVGLIHAMESDCRFDRHLHNGDSLTARTVHVPAGRPAAGDPPFAWEASAIDALALRGLPQWSDWTVPGALFRLERWNGWGYRLHHPDVLTPYLWSFTRHYHAGKYIADGQWSPTAISQQCGAAAILWRLLELGADVWVTT